MERRTLLKQAALAAVGVTVANIPVWQSAAQAGVQPQALRNKGKTAKKVLTIAHITDVHIRPEYNAVERFKKCLELIRKHKVDFILNGGDSIYAADYDNITKDRVLELWKCWNDSVALVKDIPMYSVLGNHDMWWKGVGDELYGKPGVLKMLGLQNSYYSFDKNGWHFIMLDSNHPQTPGMLDETQWKWFTEDVAADSQGQPTPYRGL